MGVTVQNKLGAVLRDDSMKCGLVGESFAPLDRPWNRWVMDQNNPKQPLGTGLLQNAGESFQLTVSNSSNGKKRKTGVRGGQSNHGNCTADPKQWKLVAGNFLVYRPFIGDHVIRHEREALLPVGVY